MDNTSESASIRPWLWVTEALASFGKKDNSTLQDSIDVTPVVPNNFGKNTRELVARRCLESLFGSAAGLNFDASSCLDSRVRLDFSRSCEDVLQQILHEIPLSSLGIAGVEILERDVYPFMMHKRVGSIKLELEQLKESVIEGTHPCAEHLKERSGLTIQNQDYRVPANVGKINDLPEKDNENCNIAENMGTKKSSSSKERSHGENFLPSKRNRDSSVDVHGIRYLHEKQVDVEERNDFLRSAKKNKCYAPSNIEFKNDRSCQTTFLIETKDDDQHHIEPIPASIDDPENVQHKSSKSQSEQEIDIQLKEPNAAYPNRSQLSVSSDEVVVDAFNGFGAEHHEMIDFTAKRHVLFSFHCLSSHDFSANTERGEQNLCMKCNEGGPLLVCTTTTCQLKVHESCLIKSAQFGGKGNFLCPFCAYSCAVSEYLEAKKKVFVGRNELCIFLGKGIEDQATELLEVYRKENSYSAKHKCENIHVNDNGNDQPGTGREDNQEHVNKVNNLKFERSQQQPEPPTPCDDILPSCRKKGTVNNMINTVLTGEETGRIVNPKFSSVETLEENELAEDDVTVVDNLFGHVLSVKQNTTGEENQQEMLEEYSTDRTEQPVCVHDSEEDISEDGSEKPIKFRYSMRSRKHSIQYKPPAIRLLRKRRNIPWTAEEEDMLMEGVQKFRESEQQKIPWKQILEFGTHVFLRERRPGDLKDKWKNICKAKRKLK